MQRKTLWIGLGLIAVAAAWYLFRPERLFVNVTVNETFPGDASKPAVPTSNGPLTLASGRFHDVAHKSTGVATIYQLSEGKRLLRLSEFETSNGPELQLYLVAAADAKDDATVTTAGFVTLGALKGNKGDQNYELPADLDLTKYQAVTVWCRRFGVNFATAPLASQGDAASSAMATVPLLLGHFHSVAHESAGIATVYQLPGGKRLLRLTGFHTSNGPDVQLYLVAAADARDNATVTTAGFVSLGALKGNQGDQNYDVPAGVDLAKYRAVTVWCRRFGVNFATAPLGAPTGEGKS